MVLKSRGIRRRRSGPPVSYDERSVGSRKVDFKPRRADETAFIDEIGSPYYKGDPSSVPLMEEFFGQAITITDDPERLAQIMRLRRIAAVEDPTVDPYARGFVMKGGELKSKKDSEKGRREVYGVLAAEGFKRRGYYVDHAEPPPGWSDNGTRNRKIALEYTVDRILDETEGDIYFVVDHCDAYSEDFEERLIAQKFRDGRKVGGAGYNSDEGPYALQLQANDYTGREMLERLRLMKRSEETQGVEMKNADTPFPIRRIGSFKGYSKSRRSVRTRRSRG